METRISFQGLAVCALFFSQLMFVAGCANPGPPKPPSLHLPKLATKLTANRVGNRVEVQWTTDPGTTDGGTLHGAITAVLCREMPAAAKGAGTIAPVCATPVHREIVVPGPSRAVEELPAQLANGSVALLAYRVELLNDRHRSAGLSAPVYAAAGAAPPAAGAIAVATRRNGLLVTWQATAGSERAPMHLTRTLVATAAGPVAPAKPKKSQSLQKPKETASSLTLVPETTGDDPGGTVDRTLHDGDTVSYVAQRIESVELAAPATSVLDKKGNAKKIDASTQTLELRGEPSASVTFTFHDTIAPDAPTSLAGVPGGGFGQPASIDLSWEPNAEGDILGYNVYRADAGGADWRKLNAELVDGPAYRDLTAQAGHVYRYRVTAVDQRHNESAPSGSSQQELKPQ